MKPCSQGKKSNDQHEKKIAGHRGTTGEVFIECFAGCGELSKAVNRVGIQTEPPQDALWGGVDFTDNRQVLELWEHWRSLRAAGLDLLFHFAPPCNTFSRARDRSWKTKLRSHSLPAGLDPSDPKAEEANEIARSAARSITFFVNQLGARGTLEQPASSYMLPFLDQEGLLPPMDRCCCTSVDLVDPTVSRRCSSPLGIWTWVRWQ